MIAVRMLSAILPPAPSAEQSSSGTLNAWRLAKGDREPPGRVYGPLIFITIDLILDATLDGLGLAYLPSDQVEKLVKSGKLRGVLSKWTQPLAH
jgi:DNA-binding transcriptional LysR family regulator